MIYAVLNCRCATFGNDVLSQPAGSSSSSGSSSTAEVSSDDGSFVCDVLEVWGVDNAMIERRQQVRHAYMSYTQSTVDHMKSGSLDLRLGSGARALTRALRGCAGSRARAHRLAPADRIARTVADLTNFHQNGGGVMAHGPLLGLAAQS